MKRLPHEIYQENSSNYGDKKWLSLPSAPVVLSQSEGFQDLPDWLLFVLAFSPIVAIIILLSIGIVALLLILWLRSRRQQQRQAGDQTPSPPPVSVEQAQDTVPTALADTGELPAIEPVLKTDPLETIPLGTVTAEDLGTGPGMPVIRVVDEPQTIPISGQRPANIGWQIAGLTDVGMRRDHNEDCLLMVEATIHDATPYGLYVVADGLGGHEGGEIASQLSIDAIREQFTQHPPSPTAAPFDNWLKGLALAANEAVLSRQEDQTQAKKMGSTLVMALVAAGQAHIGNVGDSRAYHLNNEGIHQISEDHSLVERLIQIGQLTREEARTHKNRNVIYNTIGDKPDPEVGLYHISLQPGDRLLLCSDGLNDMLSDEALLEISHSQASPAAACKAMVESANLAGGNDNITVIIVQMDA